MVKYIEDKQTKAFVADKILNQLPDWFGLPDSTNEYIKNSKDMPFWTYYIDNKPVGFIALKQTGQYSAEIYVMGVLKAYHRQGIGKALWEAFLLYAKNNGFEYVQVKTVKKGKYESYDITNNFYESLGFKELECFPNLWDEWNPCQIYIRYIG